MSYGLVAFYNIGYGLKAYTKITLLKSKLWPWKCPNFSNMKQPLGLQRLLKQQIANSATWPSKINRSQCSHDWVVNQEPSGQYH